MTRRGNGTKGAAATAAAFVAAVLLGPIGAAAQPSGEPTAKAGAEAPAKAAAPAEDAVAPSAAGGAKVPGAAGADEILEGEVTDPTRQLYPIAVVDLKGSGGVAEAAAEASRVLRKDLVVSGFFNVIPPKTVFFDASAEGIGPEGTDFGRWASTGAKGIVKGQLSPDGDGLRMDLRLLQVGTETQVDLGIAPRKVTSDRVHLEVHRFVNALIHYFTGQRGIFGSQIAFVSRIRGGNKVVGVMDLDGKHVQMISRSDALSLLPAWSPGGNALIYTSYAAGNPDLVLHTLGSKAPVVMSRRSGLNVGGAYAPAGNIVALTLSKDGNSEIYAVSASTGKIVQRLTSNWATDTSPSWSPDSKRIAFVSDRAGSPQVYVMNADGSGVRRLTFRGNYNTTPDWSPKGDKIAFTGRDERYRFDIFTVDVASGEVERLTQGSGNNEEPAWSPDGNYIAFTSTRERGSKLFVMTADGLQQTRISEDGASYHTPAWGPVPSFR